MIGHGKEIGIAKEIGTAKEIGNAIEKEIESARGSGSAIRIGNVRGRESATSGIKDERSDASPAVRRLRRAGP